MKVKVLCGVSGSGKSTLIDKKFSGALVCSADHHFVVDGEYRFNPSLLPEAHSACLRKYTEALQAGVELVVVDNTNTSVGEVAPYSALALAYGYELEIIVLSCSPQVGYERNRHNVPLAAVQAQYERLASLDLPPWWPVTRI